MCKLGSFAWPKKVYIPSWGDKPHNLTTGNAVVTKDPNKVTSEGIIKSGHHTACKTGMGKKEMQKHWHR